MTQNTSRVAAVQMTSGNHVATNLAVAKTQLQDAANAGAELVVLPENFAFMGAVGDRIADVGERENAGDRPIQAFLAEHSRALGIWLIGGTVPIATDDEARVAPACLVYNMDGERVARYDKIHLFDVGLPGSSDSYRESARFVAGPPQPQVIDTPFGRLGLTVCYDLRFAELYRALVLDGAEIVVAPSAFTRATGEAHWHVLARARAIENQCALIAPNQGGHHIDGRDTYGHSLIVDAWGRVLAEAGPRGPTVVVADIDHAHARELRTRFPVADHHRLNV